LTLTPLAGWLRSVAAIDPPAIAMRWVADSAGSETYRKLTDALRGQLKNR
jgi:hypothetical protein